MNPQTRRIVFSLAVLAWSGVLLYFHASGRITKYLAPDFRPLAFAGGLGLGVLGAFNLLTAGWQACCGHNHGGDGGEHDHENSDVHPVLALLLMILPVGLSVAWTKDEYSAAALSRKGLYDAPGEVTALISAAALPPLTREEIERNHRRTPDGFFEFSLMELFFATGDRDLQSAIDGLKVETEGRWMDEKTGNRNLTRKRLYRLFITCCAADSRAIPIVLEFGGQPPVFPENGWVKASGTMRFPLEDGVLQPVLFVERTSAAEPPYEEGFLRR